MANKANSLSHAKRLCKYHIVFTPKYRRKVIYGQYKESIREIIRTLYRYKGVEIIEGHMMSDHVHLLLSIPPKMSVSNKIVLTMPYKPLIGISSAAIYDTDGVLKAVSVNRNETFPKEKSSEVFNFDSKFSGKTIKVIIFDGLESMKPLGYGECFDIEIAR